MDIILIPGYLDTWIPGYLDTWMPGYLDTWRPGYLDSWIPGYLDTWIPGYLDTWIPGYLYRYLLKLYEFFVAPITTFWTWFISFIIFLCALTYVLLIKTPIKPTWVEWYLLTYVVTFGMET